MQLWQLLLCCVFCTQRREHLYCSGYTSELRPVRAQLVAEDGTTHVISYDPVYVTSAGAAYDVCSLFGCITDVSALEKDIDRLLAACISKSYRPPDYSILIPLVDASTAVELHRLHAASADYALHFQRSVAEWCSDHSHGGSCAVTNVLVELIDLSLKLFSENKYDETFALCYAIFSFLIEHAAVRDAGAVTEEQMGWAYIAYAESARMTGNFNASAWGYNMRLSMEHSGPLRRLYELRAIIATPPVPPDYDTSRRWRGQMIDDLRRFTTSVVAERHTVTTEDLMMFASTPFNMCHQGLNDREVQMEIFKAHRALCPDLTFVSAALSAGTASPSRVAVGFVSRYFTDHSIGRILVETIYFLVKNHPSLDIVLFYINDELDLPPSERSGPSFLTRALDDLLGPSRMIHVRPHVADIRETLAAFTQPMDILVFTDVGMDLLTYLLAASRFAYYQMVWWGHPITVGMPPDDQALSIDFYLSLDVELPNAAIEDYTEQMVRMEYINTAPFVKIALSPTHEAERQLLLESLRMPPTAQYCLVIGRVFKLHPVFDEAVRKILDHNPSVYIVFIFEKVAAWNHIVMQRLAVTFGSDMMNRIRLGRYQRYTDLIVHADVMLDTFPYGGCLTTHDALSNGIPMVTLPSDYVRGRYTLAMYRQMGHNDLVAVDLDDYVDLVTKLLRNATFREFQKQTIDRGFRSEIHKNTHVAAEWATFFTKLAHHRK